MRLSLQSNELKVVYKKVIAASEASSDDTIFVDSQTTRAPTERTLSRPMLLEAKQKRCGLSSMALYPRQNSRFAFDFQVYHLTLFFTMRHLSFIFNIAAWDATLEFHNETWEFWHPKLVKGSGNSAFLQKDQLCYLKRAEKLTFCIYFS